VTAAALEARSGDVRIAYDVLGSGPPLLLCQGLGYTRLGWGPARDLLAEHFAVVSFDNRGIGESDVPPGPYTAALLASDALAVLDAAGVERAHVVGASLGGMVAQEFALAASGRVDRLVLACTTPGGLGSFPMPARTVALIAKAALLEPLDALRRFVVNALSPDAPAELVDEIYAHRRAHPPDLGGWQAQAAAGTTFDALDRIGAINAPTLVLHGTADNVVDHRNGELLAERIPNVRLRLFPGAGHLFFWEQPELFATAIREFLR
jgi:pimeloyl-ACP methyl ester carboxylesterase